MTTPMTTPIELNLIAPHMTTPVIMQHYAWILPAEDAFSLYDVLPESCIFEGDNGLWHVDYYCPADQALHADFLSHHPKADVSVLPDQDWVAHSAIATPPVVVGDFYVHTSDYPPLPEYKYALCVPATMAFGSGHHATTQGCLALIQEVWAATGWKKALDFGCGSGILAMAMNRLLPGSAMGMDNDPQAVGVAQENALMNACPTVFIEGDGVPADASFDCIVANVYGPILIDLAPQFSGARHVILSGILQVQADSVVAAYAALGWVLETKIDVAEWSSLLLKK